jgi:outer membrane immunogenic protein
VRSRLQVLRKKENTLRSIRTLIVIVILVAIAGSTAYAGKTSFGIKAGLNMSNASDVPKSWEDSIEWETGFTGGVFVNHALSDNFSLQPELLYTQKGFGGSLIEDVAELTLSLGYFELPILAKYAFSAGKKFRPTLFAGPTFAYCSSSELTFSTWIFSADIDFSSLTHVTDFGVVLGGGFDYEAGAGTLIVDARFTYNFTKVIVSGDFEINGDTETIEADNFTNYGLSLTFGYAF